MIQFIQLSHYFYDVISKDRKEIAMFLFII